MSRSFKLTEQDRTTAEYLCHRCMQPVPPQAARCPGCGERIQRIARWPFIAGAIALLALGLTMLLIFRAATAASEAQPDKETQSDVAPLDR